MIMCAPGTAPKGWERKWKRYDGGDNDDDGDGDVDNIDDDNDNDDDATVGIVDKKPVW